MSSTNWAQGGIAGVLDPNDLEGLESHVKDTLDAGLDYAMSRWFEVLSPTRRIELEI